MSEFLSLVTIFSCSAVLLLIIRESAVLFFRPKKKPAKILKFKPKGKKRD